MGGGNSEIEWRINLLGFAGAIIGIIAIFSTWYVTIGQLPGSLPINHNLIDSLTSSNWVLFGEWITSFCCISFLIGTLVSIISPAGFIIQLIALTLLTTIGAGLEVSGRTKVIDGPLLGLLSGFINLLAIIKPFGFGFKGEQNHLIHRLLNVTLNRK